MEALKIIQDLRDGKENPLKALALFKLQKDQIQKYIDEVEPLAMDEANKYESNSFKDYGFSFERRTGGPIYNYKSIPQWQEADKKKKEIEKNHKSAYLSYQNGINSVDENGEILMMPEVSNRKDSIVVKRQA